MEKKLKKYNELTADELYDIMKLRVDVFVVEQNCPYHELDGLDKIAYHLWLEDSDGIAAYLRILPPGAAFGGSGAWKGHFGEKALRSWLRAAERRNRSCPGVVRSAPYNYRGAGLRKAVLRESWVRAGFRAVRRGWYPAYQNAAEAEKHS